MVSLVSLSTLTLMEQRLQTELKQLLETQRAELTRQLGSMARTVPGATSDYQATVPQFGDKEEDNAAEVAEFTDNLSLERTLEATLRDVDKALQRIAKGTYGVCVYCGQPIDERRLRARPESSACVKCKEERLRRSVI